MFNNRDIKDTTVGTLSQRITNQLMGLKGLSQQLNEIHSYLDKVSSGQLPVNHQIIYLLQVRTAISSIVGCNIVSCSQCLQNRLFCTSRIP